MKKSIKIIHWLPRIICIMAIIFVSLFALDSFGSELTIWQKLSDFFMHLIPSFVLLGILILAWKKELIGGIIFILIGLILSPYVYKMNYNMNHSVSMSLGIVLTITFPFAVVGVLFLISYFMKRAC